MKKIVEVSVAAVLVACGSDNSIGGGVEVFPVDEFGNAVACVVELEGVNAEANGTIVTCSNGQWIPYVDPNQNNPGPGVDNGNGQPYVDPNTDPDQPFYDDLQSSQSGNPWIDNPVASSSSAIPVPSNQFTDTRDGYTYRTKVYGSQTWMIENLKYNTSESYCNYNNPSYCEAYGRRYSWSAAQTACPPGWHLPTGSEWETLFQVVGAVHRDADRWGNAGTILKSRMGWSIGNGEDRVDFNIKPAGYYNPESEVSGSEGFEAGFWEAGNNDGWGKFVYKVGGGFFIERETDYEYYGYSVRCVQ